MGALSDELLGSGNPFSEWDFGALSDSRPVGLMRVGLDADGIVRFRAAEPAECRWALRRQQWRDAAGREHESAWPRREVRAPARDGTVRTGDRLLLRRYPLSHLETDSAVFKRGSRKARSSRPDAASPSFDGEAQMIRWIESLPHDYWENGTLLVAGISRLAKGLHAASRRERNTTGGYVYGISSDQPPVLETAMWDSPAAVELRRWTRDGSLRFWKQDAAQKMGNLPTLTQDERDAAPTLLQLAIRMALAGPKTSGDKWTERPAMELADQLYRNLVLLHYRRARARSAPLVGFSDDEPDDEM